MRNGKIPAGSVFSNWTVVYCKGTITGNRRVYRCRCVCGTRRTVMGQHLKSGKSKSCGCQANKPNERWTLGGMSKDPAYNSWYAMRRRCLDDRHRDYKNYGGRGITCCERWADFLLFAIDMGPRPKGMSLDRIDNDGNYEPSNCRWATPTEQAANRFRRVNSANF